MYSPRNIEVKIMIRTRFLTAGLDPVPISALNLLYITIATRAAILQEYLTEFGHARLKTTYSPSASSNNGGTRVPVTWSKRPGLNFQL